MTVIRTSAARGLSRRADLMPRSAIREIMALAAGRDDVIHLEVGEPDFGTPDHIVERAWTEVRGGATRYTGNAGRPTLRTAVADRVARRTGMAVDPDRVIITVGAVGALFTALMAILDSGRRDPAPGSRMAELRVDHRSRRRPSGALSTARKCRVRSGRRRSGAAHRSADQGDCPQLAGQPDRRRLSRARSWRAIGALAEQTGVHLISDEIYEDIVFDGARHVSFLRACARGSGFSSSPAPRSPTR